MNKKFFHEVGVELKKFAKAHYKTQKRFAAALGISEGLLSKYIAGSTEMPAKLVTLLTDKLGFPKDPFVRYYSLNDIAPEVLNKDEMIRVVYEYQVLLERQKQYIDKLESNINAVIRSIAGVTKEISDLTKQNQELKSKLMLKEEEFRYEELQKYRKD